jgi:DNA polymerase theta
MATLHVCPSSSSFASSQSPSLWSIACVCDRLGLPPEIRSVFERKGLTTLYHWQADCLINSGVVDGRNLIYCAPTSGGKSLVADLITLRTVLASRNQNSKVIIVLPFVSLVSEKERELRLLLNAYNRSVPEENRIQVKAFHGAKNESLRNPKTFKGRIIFICTIEKSSSIFNALLSSDRMDQLR